MSKIDIYSLYSSTLPFDVYEEIEILVSVYNILCENGENAIEANRYFKERLDVLIFKATGETKNIYSKILENFLTNGIKN